jgi:hypothetical protein
MPFNSNNTRGIYNITYIKKLYITAELIKTHVVLKIQLIIIQSFWLLVFAILAISKTANYIYVVLAKLVLVYFLLVKLGARIK